jgi:DNA-binding MarR family transcriptional regulator
MVVGRLASEACAGSTATRLQDDESAERGVRSADGAQGSDLQGLLWELLLLRRAVEKSLRTHLRARFGIRLEYFELLDATRRLGPCRPRDLESNLGLTETAVAKLIRSGETRRDIITGPRSASGQITSVRLTENGERLLATVLGSVQDDLAALLGSADREKTRQFVATFRRLQHPNINSVA